MKGDVTVEGVEAGAVHCWSWLLGSVCSLVMVRLLGTRPAPPLAFRFFGNGAPFDEGDACLDRFLGVIEFEVVCEVLWGIA